MPKAAPAASAGTPVSGDHSNSLELSSPVVEETAEPINGDLTDLGSHRKEGDSAETQEVKTEEVETKEEVIPARLKGKDLSQVYQEFAGLEQEYSRQGNELGEARNLLREALKQSLKQPENAKATEEPEPTDDEIISDPKGSMNKLVEKAVKPLKQAILTAEQRAMMVEFNSRHPGYQQEVKTLEFQKWVESSPYRTRLFKAAANFDLDAADDLFNAWGEVKPPATSADAAQQEEAAQKKREAIKRAATETGGAGKTAAGKSGKKIYKSSELMRLYTQDRERYNEMSEEIRQAFAEGRVR